MTLKDHSFVKKFKVSFSCIPEVVTFKFWELFKNASEVTLVPKKSFPKNFELGAKFRGVQSKPG
jgi:hypothetical protein